jgi:hypothetical protein
VQFPNVKTIITTPSASKCKKNRQSSEDKTAAGRCLFLVHECYLRCPPPAICAPPPWKLNARILPVLKLLVPTEPERNVFGLEKVLNVVLGVKVLPERIAFDREKLLKVVLGLNIVPERSVFAVPLRRLLVLNRGTLEDETLDLLVTKFLGVPVVTFCLKAGFRFHTLWLPPQCLWIHQG